MQNKLHPEELELKGVYRIVNLITNEYYVGYTVNSFIQRYKQHLFKLKAYIHHAKPLNNAYNKFGGENFEFQIFEVCDNEKDAKQIEEYEISIGTAYNALGNPNYVRVKTYQFNQKNADLNNGFASIEKTISNKDLLEYCQKHRTPYLFSVFSCIKCGKDIYASKVGGLLSTGYFINPHG